MPIRAIAAPTAGCSISFLTAGTFAIARCNTPWAPWYVIPADRKWYRNYAVSQIVLHTLKKLDLEFPEAEEDLDKVVIPD